MASAVGIDDVTHAPTIMSILDIVIINNIITMP